MCCCSARVTMATGGGGMIQERETEWGIMSTKLRSYITTASAMEGVSHTCTHTDTHTDTGLTRCAGSIEDTQIRLGTPPQTLQLSKIDIIYWLR